VTRNEFAAECASRLIDPALALENETVRAALKARDDHVILETLDTEF
jgi:hypothetical protein